MNMLEGNELRAKQYFRHLIKEKGSVAKVAKEVQRPDGMSKSALEGRIYNTMALNNRNRLTQETAELLAPVLQVTVDELMNPPPSFVPSENGQPAAPEKMSEHELISVRCDRLLELMVTLSLKELDQLVQHVCDDFESREAMKELLTMVTRKEVLLPESIVDILVTKGLVEDPLDILVEYTDDEDREKGRGKYARPEKKARKKREPRAAVPAPEPAEPKRKPGRKPREKPPQTAAPAAPPSKSRLRLDLTPEERQKLFSDVEEVVAVRQNGMVILRQEVAMTEKDFLAKYLS